MINIIHLLIPSESNNHKAKVIQPIGLLLISALFVIAQSFLGLYVKNTNSILGYASQISVSDVVSLTNQKRSEAGLPALTLNNSLSNGAVTKGNDMITRDYWAHVSPDGMEPWVFFKAVGYKYRYAGENLARDFSNAGEAVNAWMNSPTHKENILNPKYKEIGIGVVEGDLAGSDTTIIVQFFGTASVDRAVQPLAQVPEVSSIPVATEVPKVEVTPVPEVKAIDSQPSTILVSPFTTTRNASLIIISILLLVFVIDAYLVSKRKITRIAGRTFAHVIFLVLIFAIILLLKSGRLI